MSAPLGHILNFYEDFDLLLADCRVALSDLLGGRMGSVDEKIDGQNFTFTLRGGRVETFYKGAPWSRVSLGGRKIEDYVAQYADRPRVAAAYIAAHQAVQSAIDASPAAARSLFLEGRVVLNCEMVVCSNLNTVPYEQDTICFFGPHAVDPALGGAVNRSAYDEFVSGAVRVNSRFKLRHVPMVRLQAVESAVSESILGSLDRLVVGTHNVQSIGDLLVELILRELPSLGLSDADMRRVARRIALEDKGAYTLTEAKRVGRKLVDEIDRLESGTLRSRAVAPFERVFHRVAYECFSAAQFEVAPNDAAAGEPLRAWVESVRTAHAEGRIAGTHQEIEKVDAILGRIDLSLFGKPVEGIVFPWRGKTRKLTGAFTPINKLRGMFTYGKQHLKIFGRGAEVP